MHHFTGQPTGLFPELGAKLVEPGDGTFSERDKETRPKQRAICPQADWEGHLLPCLQDNACTLVRVASSLQEKPIPPHHNLPRRSPHPDNPRCRSSNGSTQQTPAEFFGGRLGDAPGGLLSDQVARFFSR